MNPPNREPIHPPVCAIDIGGVLRDRRFDTPRGRQRSTASLPLSPSIPLPTVPGAHRALRALAQHFDGRLHIVSKAHSVAEQRGLMNWLADQGFLDMIPAEHVRFVPKKHLKADVCEQLGVTHAIDDQLERVLAHLSTVRVRIWFTGGGALPVETSCPRWATRCDTFDQVLSVVETSFKWQNSNRLRPSVPHHPRRPRP